MMMTFRTSLSLTLPPPPVVFWTYSVCNGPAETRIPGVSVGTPGHDTAMDAITLDTVRSLAEFRAQRGCALSLYLDLDPSTTPTAAELDSRISSLLSRAREEAQEVDSHDGRVGVGEDIERIEAFFDGEFERDEARGLALFSDGPDGLWRVVELPEPVEDALSLGDELNLAPLAPLLGHREALVAFVGREQGLVLALRGGRLEPVAEQFD